MLFFLVMVTITALDVALRYFFSRPLSGTIELTEFFMVIVFFSSVAYTQWTGGHIFMDVITAKLSRRRAASAQTDHRYLVIRHDRLLYRGPC